MLRDLSALRRTEVTKSWWKHPWCSNSGVDDNAGQSRKRLLNDATAQALSLLAAAVSVIPRLNGSVLDSGSVNSRRSSYNLTKRRVRNQALKSACSKSFSVYVNSSTRKNVTKARQKAACNIGNDLVD